jgi:drug/metabolite transporter (DMT)-like permease
MAAADLFKGVLYALAAGLMWGLVFVAPALLPEYPPTALAFGRYLAFGTVAVVLALTDRSRLSALSRQDWAEAVRLALVGNIIYYLFLSAGIQAAGVPLASVIIGTLPVVIAVCANWHDRSLPWLRLLPSLVLIVVGIGFVNQSEMGRISAGGGWTYVLGAALSCVAVAAWTWYPIRNAAWLKAHPGRSATTWTTAQGLATLPLAAMGWIACGIWQAARLPEAGWWMGLGPRPGHFLLLMLAMGLFASWLGTLLWSRASKLLPTSLTGQLIVFETLSALAYGFWQRGEAPGWVTLAGIGLLVAGVVTGVSAFGIKSDAVGALGTPNGASTVGH